MAGNLTDDTILSTVTWVPLTGACPKCQALAGKQWVDFDVEQRFLEDPFFGIVWDLDQDTSLAHPNCRCHLEIDPNLVRAEEELTHGLDNVRMSKITGIQEYRANLRELRKENTEARLELLETVIVLNRFEGTLAHLGLTDNAVRAIRILQDLQNMAWMSYRAIELLDMLLTTELGPMALVFAIARLIGYGMTAGTLIYDVTRGT